MNSLLTLAYQLSRMAWKVISPITIGVRVILEQDGRFVLVKPSYQTFWTLPGGGVERGETLEQAARREILEEVGAQVGALRLLGVYTSFQENKNDHIVVFAAQNPDLASDVQPDHPPDVEIERFGLFTSQSLPDNTAPGVRRRLAEYLANGTQPNFSLW
jgi:ADP-ribose pyrophosphatase YjhB (NUDIX family)